MLNSQYSKAIGVLLLFTPALLTAAPPQDREKFYGHDVAAQEVLIRFRDNASPLSQIQADHDVDKGVAIGQSGKLYLLHSRSEKVPELIQKLSKHPALQYAEPNYIVTYKNTPNDPSFGQMWGLQNTGQNLSGTPGTPGADIRATPAWDFSTGSSNIVAGVIDTGVDVGHPDLAANIWSAPSSFTVTVGGQTITCPAGSHGYDAINNNCSPTDSVGHGTHVAGTIGATGNNSTGVTGVNWRSSIMVLRFMDSNGGTTANAVNCIDFAIQAKQIFGAAANVRVLSNSWGGTGSSQALLDAINRANNADILFVVAAGNNGTNNDTTPFYPASYSAPNLISVAATTSSDARASFSNYGAATVNLGAPGEYILSTLPNNTYGYYSGTSMATPHVSGAAALILSTCTLNTASLRAAILGNVDLIPSMSGITTSGGRLNVANAMRSCLAPGLLSTSISPSVVASGAGSTGTVTLTSAAGSGGAVVSLSSTNPALVNVPASITVPAGAVSATFPISASTTATQASVTITASYSGTSKAAILTVNPVVTGVSATFVGTDDTTQGSWKGKYGAEGYLVLGDSQSNPSYANPTATGSSSYTWVASTTDVRALQKASGTDRIAAVWFSATSFVVDLGITGTASHEVSVYTCDFDGLDRVESIDVIDANGTVLDTRSNSSFSNGRWFTWSLSGPVKLRFNNVSGMNAVVGGIFFGGASTATPVASASFVTTDTVTSGNWKSKYGAEGFNVFGDSASNPSYGTVSAAGQSTWQWTASTADTRALQKALVNDRIMYCYFSPSSFTLDVNLTGTAAHQVAMYAADYDNFGRSEKVDVIDAATNTVLDSRTLSNFGGGQYLVWNISGHVILRVTWTGGNNAVVSGIFFGGPSNTASFATASFAGSDTTTSGNWKSKYGAEGYNVFGDSASNPPYGAVSAAGQSTWQWAASTADPRALQKASVSTDRIMYCYFSPTSFTLDVNLTGTAAHQVAVYGADYDHFGRSQRIDVIDAATNNVLDSRTMSNFSGGQYLVWNISGHVILRVTWTGGNNAVLSGIFFGGPAITPAATASFVTADTTTSGNWQGKYGSTGYSVFGDRTSNPAYGTVSAAGQSTWQWAATTTDIRALQKASVANDRIMYCYFSPTSFTMDVNLSGTAAHQVAIYAADYDNFGRAETIDVIDAATNAVLDSRSISNFTGGQYLVWNISGHVVLRVTHTAGNNAVLSGIFFN